MRASSHLACKENDNSHISVVYNNTREAKPLITLGSARHCTQQVLQMGVTQREACGRSLALSSLGIREVLEGNSYPGSSISSYCIRPTPYMSYFSNTCTHHETELQHVHTVLRKLNTRKLHQSSQCDTKSCASRTSRRVKGASRVSPSGVY